MLAAKRWPTKLTPEQFNAVTRLDKYPDYLKKDVTEDGTLNVYSNGEMIYKINGIHAKVSVIWNYQAPEGAGDTHFSMMRGSKANLVIRQGAEQNYKPCLYIEPHEKADESIAASFKKIEEKYPDVELKKLQNKFEVVIPDKYRIGHEAHFAQVTENFLKYLADGKLPDWEVPNMIAKYYTTIEALKLAKANY